MTIMTEMTPSPTPALDYDSTLIMTVEISDEKWMVAAQVPGLARVTSKRTVMPEAEELMAAIEGYATCRNSGVRRQAGDRGL